MRYTIPSDFHSDYQHKVVKTLTDAQAQALIHPIELYRVKDKEIMALESEQGTLDMYVMQFVPDSPYWPAGTPVLHKKDDKFYLCEVTKQQ